MRSCFWDSSIRLDLMLTEAIGEMKMADAKKTSNLLRLAGIINSANREADDEAGALIERVQSNQRRTLSLIAKGHQNESMRERALSEAEKEQALADLAAAVGDNGAPLDITADDTAGEEVRKELLAAKKSQDGSGDFSATHQGGSPASSEPAKASDATITEPTT